MDGYGPSGRSAWMDVDWRRYRRYEIFDGRRVNLVEIGAGPPLLFIHGLAGSWTNWLENICEFAADHRVVAIDLPGFGASEEPSEPISIPGYARLVESLCVKLEISSAIVVGNSMGGLVGVEFALRHPRRVERLCLVSAAGLSIEKLPLGPALKALSPLERVFGFYGGMVAARSATLARRGRLRKLMLLLVVAHGELLPAPLAAELVSGAGRPGLLPGLRAMTAYPIRERLCEIVCPTLVVWGERDHLVPVKDAAEFERLIAGARKIVYPDTGHVPQLERPACFNEDLRAFLQEESGEGAPVR
jgi:pimeloyl-ACP methyl ester carboxylesterase